MVVCVTLLCGFDFVPFAGVDFCFVTVLICFGCWLYTCYQCAGWWFWCLGSLLASVTLFVGWACG